MSKQPVQLTWTNHQYDKIRIKNFLKNQSVSSSFLTYLRQAEGKVYKNGQLVFMNQFLQRDDTLTIVLPPDPGNDCVSISHEEIQVVYEDRDVLVVNKPAGLVTVPSHQNREDSLANRVKGYYVRNYYQQLSIHVVTRLDRETSGLVLIAKHRLAHALLNTQLENKLIQRYYLAVLQGIPSQSHFLVNEPIGRKEGSVIERTVSKQGRTARTEYWLKETYLDSSLYKIKLHTGRTHQIRVHSQWMRHPLIGDDLYGMGPVGPLKRQALHCNHLSFQQPFTDEPLTLKLPPPIDFIRWRRH